MVPDVVRFSYVVVAMVRGIVLVHMTRPIGVDVKPPHRYTFTRSIDTTKSSSPLSNLTSKPSHLPQARIGRSRVVLAPQSVHSTQQEPVR